MHAISSWIWSFFCLQFFSNCWSWILVGVYFFAANGMLEKVANYGLSPNMTLYLMNQYHMEMTTTSNILFYWSAANNFTPVLGAIVADSYVGRFHMIGFGSVINLLVIVILHLNIKKYSVWSSQLPSQTLENKEVLLFMISYFPFL